MSLITTRPATSQTWDDVQAALTGGGVGKTCQCAWVVMRNAQYLEATPKQRREFLRSQVASETPPGLVAYVEGKPAGWVRVGPRPAHPRIVHSRVTAPSPEPMDDPTVWVVSCFSVRNEYRRKGVSAALPEAAVRIALPLTPLTRDDERPALFHQHILCGLRNAHAGGNCITAVYSRT